MEQTNLGDLLRDRLGSRFYKSRAYNGHMFIQTDASVTGAEILALLPDREADKKTQILDLGSDAAKHTNIFNGLKQLFVPPATPKTLALPAPAAKPDPFAGFIGIDPILGQFREIADSVINGRLSNQLLGTNLPDGFLNVLLVGPKGLGKTTLSQAIAEFFRQKGIVAADAKITFIAAGKNVDKWVGHSEAAIRKMLKDNENGILILDELDAVLDSSSFGSAILTTLNTEMGNSPNRPIVIASCYGSTYHRLVSSGGGNEGLAGRFSHTVHLQSLPPETLVEIFISKIEAARLFCERGPIKEELMPLLRILQNAKKEAFANGREVDNILSATLLQRNKRLGPRVRQVLNAEQTGEHLSSGERRDFLTIYPEDIPDFDSQTRMFVSKPPMRTTAMGSRVSAAASSNNVFSIVRGPTG